MTAARPEADFLKSETQAPPAVYSETVFGWAVGTVWILFIAMMVVGGICFLTMLTWVLTH